MSGIIHLDKRTNVRIATGPVGENIVYFTTAISGEYDEVLVLMALKDWLADKFKLSVRYGDIKLNHFVCSHDITNLDALIVEIYFSTLHGPENKKAFFDYMRDS